jgi:ParB family transcriptional regulator, chromosome partitioning protein
MAANQLTRSNAAQFKKAIGSSRISLFGDDDEVVVLSLSPEQIKRRDDWQPRRHFDDDRQESLKASIAKNGQLTPIWVQPAEDDDTYYLVAGERRLIACEDLKNNVKAVEVSGEPVELALIENMQRDDLNAVDLAMAVVRLIEEHEYSQQQVADIIGRDQPQVSRLLKVASLPEEIRKEYVTSHSGIGMTILMEVAAVDNPKLQKELWDRVKEGATTKELREAKRDRKVAVARPPVVRFFSAVKKIGDQVDFVVQHRDELDDAQRAALRNLREKIDGILGTE